MYALIGLYDILALLRNCVSNKEQKQTEEAPDKTLEVAYIPEKVDPETEAYFDELKQGLLNLCQHLGTLVSSHPTRGLDLRNYFPDISHSYLLAGMGFINLTNPN